jgi:HAD superfamily hydrolase (TIGR01509 family)
MTTEIRHIVFDVGKVLVNWERDRPYREVIPDEAERRRFLDKVCSMEWHQTLDEGAGIDDAIAELSAKFPHEAERIRIYKARWLDSIPSAIEGTVDILEALVAQGRDVTALTNFNQDLFRITREAYPFLDLFRGITVSGEQRLVKPDPAIFAHHAEAFGLEPVATLFFDDSPPNIAAAEQAGWNGELFTTPERMREDLERYGITL